MVRKSHIYRWFFKYGVYKNYFKKDQKLNWQPALAKIRRKIIYITWKVLDRSRSSSWSHWSIWATYCTVTRFSLVTDETGNTLTTDNSEENASHGKPLKINLQRRPTEIMKHPISWDGEGSGGGGGLIVKQKCFLLFAALKKILRVCAS